MKCCSKLLTVTTWTVLFCIFCLVASCGDDELPTDTPADSAESETKAPQPIVREWYPSARRLPQQFVQVPAPVRQDMIHSQPYNTVHQQQQMMQPAYIMPQQVQQVPQGAILWYQAGGQQQQVMQQPVQTVPQFQYDQRPWGVIPPPVKRKQYTVPAEQQTVTVPYGTWPGYGADVTGWGTMPYGAYPYSGAYPGGGVAPW